MFGLSWGSFRDVFQAGDSQGGPKAVLHVLVHRKSKHGMFLLQKFAQPQPMLPQEIPDDVRECFSKC